MRSSCPEEFYKKDVLKSFAKFTEMHRTPLLLNIYEWLLPSYSAKGDLQLSFSAVVKILNKGLYFHN